MTTQILRSSIAALAFVAMACGGGDPPGGGNGDTDGGGTADGTTGNGGTDGYVPNPNKPLVEAIPGLWELVDVSGNGACCNSECDCTDTDCAEPPPGANRCASTRDNGICAVLGCAVVDPSNPSCQYQGELAPAPSDLGPPGDACVWWWANPIAFILDGSTIRSDPPLGCPSPSLPSPFFCASVRGVVLDNGTRMEYTSEQWLRPDRSDLSMLTYVFRKMR